MYKIYYLSYSKLITVKGLLYDNGKYIRVPISHKNLDEVKDLITLLEKQAPQNQYVIMDMNTKKMIYVTGF